MIPIKPRLLLTYFLVFYKKTYANSKLVNPFPEIIITLLCRY